VQEEAQVGCGEIVSEDGGQAQQVIIVNPDHVTRLPDVGDDIGKHLVGLLVLLPELDREICARLLEEVVKQGPQHSIAKAVVVVLCQIIGEVDGNAAILLFECSRETLTAILWKVFPWPAYPQEGELLLYSF